MTNPKPQETKGFVAVVGGSPITNSFWLDNAMCENAFIGECKRLSVDVPEFTIRPPS